MRAAAGKFRRRFEAVEALAPNGTSICGPPTAALDALWDEVKGGGRREERGRGGGEEREGGGEETEGGDAERREG